jgi:SAM-dependent methyltransferase
LGWTGNSVYIEKTGKTRMDNTYLTLQYNSKARWLSYWYQIHETLSVLPGNVLVIGKGSGIVENSIKLLSKDNIQVYTLDINYSVAPDFISTVTNLPLKNEAFDATICCQVLEHLPFEQFSIALKELQRVTGNRVVLSLPHGRKHLKIACNVPFFGEKDLTIKYPFTKKCCTSKQHYWEIGRAVSRKEVVNRVNDFFRIEKEFLNEINCYHRFFVLAKK